MIEGPQRRSWREAIAVKVAKRSPSEDEDHEKAHRDASNETAEHEGGQLQRRARSAQHEDDEGSPRWFHDDPDRHQHHCGPHGVERYPLSIPREAASPGSVSRFGTYRG